MFSQMAQKANNNESQPYTPVLGVCEIQEKMKQMSYEIRQPKANCWEDC